MGADVDVLVAGGGPAGIATATALVERGLDVLVVAPAPDRPWRATYGAWQDELAPATDPLAPPTDPVGPPTDRPDPAATALDAAGTRTWPSVLVVDPRGTRAVTRPYVRFDTPGLQAALTRRAEDAGVRVEAGTVAGVRHSATGSTVVRRDGGETTATLVVDATGHRGALVRRAASPRPRAVQAAYGVVADFPAPPVAPGTAVLMDFTAGHLPRERRGADPTFLYAMHLGGDRFFVEETSLARRPALPSAELADRLHRRLAARGAPAGRQHEVEHVRIPMDTPLPLAGQRVLAAGAAASLVHPATGYLLAATLARTPAVADAVVAGLGTAGGGPARAAALGWAALWPPERVRARRLHAFGLEALLGMDAPATGAFFRAFFATPGWEDYLSGRQPASGTLAFMARLYTAAPGSARRRLRAAVLGPAARLLASAVSGTLPAGPVPADPRRARRAAA